jgi:hypothetical protein
MDILKLLATTQFIDADPASDAEERPMMTNAGAGMGKASEGKKGKKSKKTEAKYVSNEMTDELSIESIIEDKPGKKKIIKFLKNRIEHYLDSDSD